MTRKKVLLIAVILTSCLFTSLTVNAQGRGGGGRGGERNGERGGGERGERPKKEEVTIAPSDDTGFIQTKTLEEIGGYKIGDVVADFELKNVNDSTFSIADIEDAKGYIVVFTCNECPYAKMYEGRLIALHNTYAPKGYTVIAINANVTESNEEESFAAMQKRAEEKAFPFVYLVDEDQKTASQFGAVRTPHAFLLDSDKKVRYIGAIDDNAKSAGNVVAKYVELAILDLEKGIKPFPSVTKAVGCPVNGSN